MELRDQLQSVLGTAYHLERELTGGGMSRVFVADDATLDRKVVVKVLAPELAGSVNFERFKREISTAARLQHPHVVPLLTAGEVDGLPYFTMPFVEGESLRRQIARGELPISQAIGILRDVAKALDYAHSKGVVHRDIKPDNVLISGASAAVTDFGVAKALATATHGGATLTSIGVALGTPAYMAPEQAAGDANVDHRADIYAFGVTAYEMLTGRTPFAGRSAQQQLAAHATETPDAIERVRPAVPQPLADLVRACLEKRPADRPQSAAAILERLEAVATPTRTTAYERPGWGASRRARWIAGVTSLVIAAAAAFVAVRARTPALSAKRVLVAPLENLTGDSSLSLVGRIAADWLSQSVSQLDSVQTVAPDAVSTGATATARGAGGARELAQRLHAGTVVWGSYYKNRDSLRLEARVTDVASGKLLRTMEASGPAADPLVAIRALGDRLMGAIATTDVKGLDMGLAPRWEAYQEYSRGYDRFVRQDFRGAIPLFRHAIELDSTMVNVYGILSVSYSNLGNYAAADSTTRLVERRGGQLGRVNRAFLDVARAGINGDRETIHRIASTEMRLDSSWAWTWLTAYPALLMNRPAETVQILSAARPPATWFQYWIALALAYHAIGDYAADLRAAERGDTLHPGYLVGPELSALAALGNVGRITTLIDSVSSVSTDTLGDPARLMLATARELRAHGHAVEASALLARARAWIASQPAADLQSRAALRRLLADVQFAMARYDSAQTLYGQLASLDTIDVMLRARLASSAAHRGDTTTATRIADELSRLDRPYSFGSIAYARATIAATLGQKELAARLIDEALKQGSRTMPLIHQVEEFQSLRGFAPFEEILRPKG